MATHSSILAWKIPMERGAWWACSPWGCKESDMTEQLSTQRFYILNWRELVKNILKYDLLP